MAPEVLDSGVAAPTSRESSRCWTFMPLSGKRGEGKFVLFDSEDFEEYGGRPWHLIAGTRDHVGYACRRQMIDGKERATLLHREILGLEFGDPREGDHINRDTLDNRRSNLRIVTRGQQLQNVSGRGGTSRHRGVFHMGSRYPNKPWLAYAKADGKRHCIGYFATEDEAAQAARAFRAEHMPYATD